MDPAAIGSPVTDGRVTDAPVTDAPVTDAPVTNAMLGCWRRSWIRFQDGTLDDTSIVIWLQTPDAMADLRVSAVAAGIVARAAGDCTVEQLAELAGSDSSSGYTRTHGCDENGVITATWHTGPEGVEYQPVTAFPEPGLLEWDATGTVMIERAPSGAYVEEWRLLPNSRDPLLHVVGLENGVRTGAYRAGDHLIVVRDRAAGAAAIDCEFSYAVRVADRFVVMHSTQPWRVGAVVDAHALGVRA
ncbi:MAG: hypothetical protein RLZZ623_94 [Actinomycetota bacterium]